VQVTDNQASFKEGEPTSVFQQSKNWVKKNRDEIIFVVVLASSVALRFAKDYYAEKSLEDGESPIYIPPVSDSTPGAEPETQSESEAEAQRRQSPEKQQVGRAGGHRRSSHQRGGQREVQAGHRGRRAT
jgi:hypothetical protein